MSIEAMKQALEALEICEQHSYVPVRLTQESITTLRTAIEQAEKQEPVAWGVFEDNLHDMFFTQKYAEDMARLKGEHAEVKPLYTTPPAAQREWVGLTDEETITQANKELFPGAFARGAIWAQLKLKEKNNG